MIVRHGQATRASSPLARSFFGFSSEPDPSPLLDRPSVRPSDFSPFFHFIFLHFFSASSLWQSSQVILDEQSSLFDLGLEREGYFWPARTDDFLWFLRMCANVACSLKAKDPCERKRLQYYKRVAELETYLTMIKIQQIFRWHDIRIFFRESFAHPL